MDRIEIEAFIGLLLLAGAYKAQYRPVSELWSLKEGQPVFRATMSEQRFKLIKGAMRFDDPARRDRLASVRFIFDLITKKFRSFVEASENLTIDEQLLEYHGRVDFRQYIGTKPGKFGIKIYWLTEAKSSYCLAGFVYIGADSILDITEESSSTTEATVWFLMQHFIGKGRQLTRDNWFTTLPLVDRLKKNLTTYVGTIRSIRRDIPAIARSTVGRTKGDTKIYHNKNNILMVSFRDKGNRPVLLVDSHIHHCPVPNIGDKPETVRFYNETKSGVDTLDKKIRMFSCKRKCRR